MIKFWVRAEEYNPGLPWEKQHTEQYRWKEFQVEVLPRVGDHLGILPDGTAALVEEVYHWIRTPYPFFEVMVCVRPHDFQNLTKEDYWSSHHPRSPKRWE